MGGYLNVNHESQVVELWKQEIFSNLSFLAGRLITAILLESCLYIA